ncbi:hypothetical protein L3Q82_014242, partial [Scortum barcoo]
MKREIGNGKLNVGLEGNREGNKEGRLCVIPRLKKKNDKKKKKKKITLFKSVIPFQLCAHSICTVDAAIIIRQVADQGSKGPTGSQ